MNDARYWDIKFKIQENIKSLKAISSPSQEQENMLYESENNIKWHDSRKQVEYVGRNKQFIDCLLPNDLLYMSYFTKKNLI